MWAQDALAIGSVTVMADQSLSVALVKIARSYSMDHQVVVNSSFTAPAAQEAQITDGGAADILITPKLPWIEKLKTQGLVDIHSQTVVAKNRLVLAGPADSTLSLHLTPNGQTAALINAMGGEQAFVVGNPETLPVGVFGKQALRSLNIADDLEPYTLYISEPDQMTDMVVNHHAYGIFFNSSIAGVSGIKVIDTLPEKSHQPVVYYAVVIAGDNMDEARNFLKYLKSRPIKKLLADSGFVVD